MNFHSIQQRVARVALGLVLMLASLVGARAAHAQGSALPKDGRFYQIRQPSGTNYSQLFVLDRYNLGSGGIPVGSATPDGTVLNALGLNPVDGYAYAMRNSTTDSSEIFRLGTGAPQSLGLLSPKLAGLGGTNFGAACFDGAGNFYITTINAGKRNAKGAIIEPQSFYRVSGLAGALNTSTLTVTEIPLSQSVAGVGLNDIAWNPADGLIYGTSSGDPRTNTLINPATGNVTFRPLNGDSSALTGTTFGTNFFDLTGNLYTYANQGKFNVIDPVTQKITFLANAAASNVTDGASNPFYRVPMTVSKTLISGVAIDARTREFTFEVTARNQSPTEGAPHFQITENLAQTFAVNSPTISITAAPTRQSGATLPLNAAFNGTTDTRLLVGANALPANSSLVLRFTVRVQYADAASVPAAASNVVYASSTSTVDPAVGYNEGFIFPSGDPVPPPDIIGSADSPPTNAVVTKIAGRVYEDVNFGGGAGRAFDSAQGMAGVAGARVEIYDASGAFVGFATSGANGTWNYDLGKDVTGTFVRVVNSSVLSTRAGSTSALIGVQTFRTQDGAPVTNEVGGRAPASADAGNGATGTTLNTSTFKLSGGATGQAQSVARVNNNAANVDFGFNFDTIVNTNNAGQGSLRQFVLNSNALTNSGLAQQGLTAGKETSIFQIPATALTSGVAKITLASTLTISDANTAIDGTTQTANIGDTNAGTFGTGGTVGVQSVALPTLPRPEIEIYGARSIDIGIDIAADSALVRGVAVWGFGSGGDTATRGTIHVGSSSSSSFVGPVIREVLLGTSAVPTGGALLAPAAGTYGSADLVRANGVDGGQILNSILAYSGGKGIALNVGADGWTIAGNEIRNNARDSITWDNIDAQVRNTTISGNLVYNSGGTGIDSYSSSGGAIVTNNTSRNNGINCTPTTGEPAGIRSYGTGNTITYNLVYNNFGAGVLVQSTATALISRNSIYGNGQSASVSSTTPSYQIGIDLLKASDAVDHGTSPYVTPNDTGDVDTGANGLLNFPIFTGYEVANGQVTLQGFAPAGSTVEVFVADPDASGFGQGKTYLFSFVEGSADDTDTTTGAYDAATLQAAGYSATVANLAGSETNARRFRVVLPANGLAANTPIAATATLNNVTSEFSLYTGNIAIASSTVSGTVYLDANRDAALNGAETGTGISGLFVKLVLQGASATTFAAPVNATTGKFSIPTPAAGNYNLILDNNATLSDITPAIPGGYTTSESPGGVRAINIGVGAGSATGLNFGLYQGTGISGTVFQDNGSSGGTANDGTQNGGEIGIEAVKIELRDSANTLLASTLTDGTGAYSFAIPAGVSGTVRVIEINPASLLSTSPDTLSIALVAGQSYPNRNFGDVPQSELTNDGSNIGTRGTSVFYPHVFTAQSSGNVTFSLGGNATPTNSEWNSVFYHDLNGNGQIDAGEPQITGPLPATAGVPIALVVQTFVPLSASDGSLYTSTLTANFTYTGSTPLLTQTLTRTDTTTVGVQSNLKLVKSVNKTQAKPGEQITYTIAYSNTSTDPLSNIVIFDATPAFTKFIAASNGPLPTGLTGVTIIKPNPNATGAIRWTFTGSLPANATGSVSFVVKVQ